MGDLISPIAKRIIQRFPPAGLEPANPGRMLASKASAFASFATVGHVGWPRKRLADANTLIPAPPKALGVGVRSGGPSASALNLFSLIALRGTLIEFLWGDRQATVQRLD